MSYLDHTQQQPAEINWPTSAPASIYAQRSDIIRELQRMVTSQMGDAEADGELLIAPAEVKPKRPPFYKVVLLNDDYTPMDFVVTILEMIFRKSHEEAADIMMQVHQKGAGICGIFTRDVAETKVDQVIEYARINDYPLQCVVEEE
jgi:ATP-dependent Clp protease adaptor protein ClpS